MCSLGTLPRYRCRSPHHEQGWRQSQLPKVYSKFLTDHVMCWEMTSLSSLEVSALWNLRCRHVGLVNMASFLSKQWSLSNKLILGVRNQFTWHQAQSCAWRKHAMLSQFKEKLLDILSMMVDAKSYLDENNVWCSQRKKNLFTILSDLVISELPHEPQCIPFLVVHE